MVKEYLPANVSPHSFNDVVDFILLIYSRMCGKDFAMKLLKNNTALKIPVRQIQVVLSDPKHRIKAVMKKDVILTEEEEKENEAFAQIAKELEEEDDEY